MVLLIKAVGHSAEYKVALMGDVEKICGGNHFSKRYSRSGARVVISINFSHLNYPDRIITVTTSLNSTQFFLHLLFPLGVNYFPISKKNFILTFNFFPW